MENEGDDEMNLLNRFYVASDKVTAPLAQSKANTSGHGAPYSWPHATMESAIKHAHEILEDGPDRDYVVIVEMVKVVRKQRIPIVVDDLREIV